MKSLLSRSHQCFQSKLLRYQFRTSNAPRSFCTAEISEDLRAYAVIKVGGEVLEEANVQPLIDALKVLQDHNKPCAVIHGGGPQLNDQLRAQNVEAQYIKGHRVTDESVLKVAKQVFTGLNQTLVDRLTAQGLLAKPFPVGVFGAKPAPKESGLGFVGEVTKVSVDEVQESLNQNEIPVITSLGVNIEKVTDPSSTDLSTTPLTNFLNINADVAARELALGLEAKKIVFISSKGGWTENGEIVPHINLKKDFKRLSSMDYTGRQGTLLKLLEIKALLDNLPNDSSVTICAADKIVECLLPKTLGIDSEETPGSTFVLGNREEAVNVGLIGARGYVGIEFCRLVLNHPNLRLTVASSRQNEHQNVLQTFGLIPEKESRGVDESLTFTNVSPQDLAKVTAEKKIDLWVLALPNGLSKPFSDEVDKLNVSAKKKVKVLDLSADNRFQDQSEWVYGLPEKKDQREMIKKALRLSNPGCYATAIQTALMPLMTAGTQGVQLRKDTVPCCFGVSGFSGAGTTPSRNNDEAFLKDNLVAYKLTQHIHELECSRFLEGSVNFMPHVAPFFQGISMTVNCFLERDADGQFPSRREVVDHFKKFYIDEPFVVVNEEEKDFNTVRSVQKKHHVEVGAFTMDVKTGRLVIVANIDNLLKGAASQAIQNVNLMFDLDEATGLKPPGSEVN